MIAAAVLYGVLSGVVVLTLGIAFAPPRTATGDDVQGGSIIVAAVATGALVGLAVGGVG